jgi:hypothetical protein
MLKDLVGRPPLQHVHFWGKISGTEQNYYVAEVDYREGNDEGDEEEEEVRVIGFYLRGQGVRVLVFNAWLNFFYFFVTFSIYVILENIL